MNEVAELIEQFKEKFSVRPHARMRAPQFKKVANSTHTVCMEVAGDFKFRYQVCGKFDAVSIELPVTDPTIAQAMRCGDGLRRCLMGSGILRNPMISVVQSALVDAHMRH